MTGTIGFLSFFLSYFSHSFLNTMASTATTDCMVCIEKFNKSTRKPVVCPYCTTSICRTCVQTILLQENTAKCIMPECKKGWSDEFLSESFTKVWIDTTYKAHRSKVLLDQEKARLPDTQEQAARYINGWAIMEPIYARMRALREQRSNLPLYTQLREMTKDKATEERRKIAKTKEYQDLLKLISKEEKNIVEEISKIYDNTVLREPEWYVRTYGQPRQEYGVALKKAVEKKWTFVGKCPKAECMGFVDLEYICGLCKVEVCKECMEPKTAVQATHACNPDTVLNVKAMRKEAKPCPKCAAMISKIDGCDQMWCTQCHTAFSWRTGEEETLVHNPHFYEWMRRTGQQMAPGAVRVGAAGAAGAPLALAPAPNPACGFQQVWTRFANSVAAAYPENCPEELNAIQQASGHIERHSLAIVRDKIRQNESVWYGGEGHEEQKRRLRVQWLAKQVTEEKWTSELHRMDRERERTYALRDIYDMYIQAVMTIMEQFTMDTTASDTAAATAEATAAAIQQYTELSTYVNEALRKYKSRFSTSAHMIPPLPTATATT